MSNEHKNPGRLLNGQYVLLTFVNFLVSVSYSMVSTIMARYLGSIGLAIALSGAITGAFSIASMVARPFTGVINDRCDRKLLLIAATAGMAGCTILYGICESYGVLLAVRLLHGMFFAFSSTVNMAVIPELVPENRVTEGISYYGVV
ncbi:MAG: MFS transporter, partial [Clostridia bacterium]|nr:MFS transporter [Clostridia bacterium]